jgi:hypothetical protein
MLLSVCVSVGLSVSLCPCVWPMGLCVPRRRRAVGKLMWVGCGGQQGPDKYLPQVRGLGRHGAYQRVTNDDAGMAGAHVLLHN